MATKKDEVDSTTFKELEQQSWTAKAGTYQSSLGTITSRAAEPLLDALKIEPGMSVLDVACGPGYGAAGAAARGAAAVGIDFAATMVAEAQRKFPTAEFREGDAEKRAGEGHCRSISRSPVRRPICSHGLGATREARVSQLGSAHDQDPW